MKITDVRKGENEEVGKLCNGQSFECYEDFWVATDEFEDDDPKQQRFCVRLRDGSLDRIPSDKNVLVVDTEVRVFYPKQAD